MTDETIPAENKTGFLNGVSEKNTPKIFFITLAAFIICCAGMTLCAPGGMNPVSSFFSAGSEVLIFALLGLLAIIAEKSEGLRILSTIVTILFILLMGAVIAAFGMISLLPPDMLTSMASFTGENISPEDIPPEFMNAAVPCLTMMIAAFIAAVFSLIVQFRSVRVRLAKYMPFDPDSFVHKTALMLIIALILILIIPLIFLGQPPMISETFLAFGSSMGLDGGMLYAEICSIFWTFAACMLVCGVFIKRTPREALKRLGFVKPTAKEAGLAVGIAVAFVFIFSAFDTAVQFIFKTLGLAVTDSEAVNKLFMPFLTPVTAVFAAIAAGITEEAAVRGVLQERFGILLPAAFFAALHALQYNWDGIISVFVFGLAAGLLRRKYHTTFTTITHAVYDLILFYFIIFGITFI